MQSHDPQMGHIPVSQSKMQASSSRILYDIPCKVCRDHSSGKHYGIFACDGCAGFFKRSIRRNRQYVCKAKSEGGCMVDKTHRNQCRACRLSKCIQAGMNKDAVQHERGPRNSTLRRQMALYFKEPEMMGGVLAPPTTALDLALPKPPAESRAQSVTTSVSHHPSLSHQIFCNSLTIPKMSTVGSGPVIPLLRKEELLHERAFIRSIRLCSNYRAALPENYTEHNRLLPTIMPISITGLPTVPIIPAESACEEAARLLFLNVRWVRDVAAGTSLAMEDQLTLLATSWRELFLLAAAQMLPTLDPSPLLPPGPQGLSLAVEVGRFREALTGFHAMNLDAHEFACIRAIVLFKAGLDSEPSPSSSSSSNGSSPGTASRLLDATTVARLRDDAQLALGQKLSGASFGTLRFGKMLLLLPTLRSVSAHTIEELFFRQTIGVAPIETIICDVYRKAVGTNIVV